MSLEAFQWNGKNALVTGSHRGLGAAIAVARIAGTRQPIELRLDS
jgi:NAD(P)-dependent dehydrogenase (short-subunit alcohol dehydrogenase family)